MCKGFEHFKSSVNRFPSEENGEMQKLNFTESFTTQQKRSWDGVGD